MKTFLPSEIIINNKVLKPVVGIGYDICLKFAKEKKLTYRTIKVLSKNLRGKTDLYGKLYQPTIWLFVENRDLFYEYFA
jgi:hypothetical protein